MTYRMTKSEKETVTLYNQSNDDLGLLRCLLSVLKSIAILSSVCG